ncbi:hypothetical protein [Streptomyces sp. NPDC058335]|uniref:hypothetical protein n=1 Tax=Streptomyces sp. NPDC058335 TaxID=3346451 RepID=UPI003645F6C0
MPIDPPSPGDEISILTAIYQAERADNAAVFTNTLTVLGFALTYMAVVSGYTSTASSLNGGVLAFAPIPACALVAYHQVMVGMNGARSHAALLLEERLAKLVPLDRTLVQESPVRRNSKYPSRSPGKFRFGVTVGEEFLDPDISSHGRRLATVLSYGCILIIAIAFSLHTLLLSFRNNGGMYTWTGALLCIFFAALISWNLWLNWKRPEVNC